ncbi:MAG: hypothetical protein GX964_02770 [Syntrophomonadaceae bacterium]|jgi:hypothetical protein|nr:hypothetical protein [Syntrophomonadaceae bacterium]
MYLRITSQPALLGLDIKKPFLRMETSPPRVELDITRARVEMHSSRPRIHIDQSECFADMERRTPLEFSWYWSGLAREAALNGIGEIAEEGDQLAAIEGGPTIADIALANTDDYVEWNIDFIPKHRPRIEFELQPVEFNPVPGRVDLHLNRGRVYTELDWGRVDVYLRQQPYLKIEYLGQNYDIAA